MSNNSRNIKRGYTKTILIIIGVIIALLMTIYRPTFTADQLDASVKPVADIENPKVDKNSGGTGSNKYNSGMRLFHVFTKNLPYLNNK